jgi:CDP-glycerol glycerophosphotransferase (TagB/SpsB family)
MRRFNDDIDAFDSEVFVSADKMTYQDVFSRASLLFTDFSSCQFDFAYLRKPVVYCHFDKEMFFSSHTYRPGYFDYERDGFGEVVYDVEEAVNLLVEYIESGCELKDSYKERIEGFFAFNDKNNCQRVLEDILKI